MILPNLYARVRFCHVHWHARPRVRQAPGLPCALFQVEGNETVKPRVKDAARSRKHVFVGWVERSDTHRHTHRR